MLRLGEPTYVGPRSDGRAGTVRGWETENSFPINKMEGHYQGYHWFPNQTESVEVYRRADGWWWQLLVPGSRPKDAPTGPFLTSTDAYLNARGGTALVPRPTSYKQGPALT